MPSAIAAVAVPAADVVAGTRPTPAAAATPGPGHVPAAVAALQGCHVTRLTIDDALTLALCGNGRELVLRIDGAGELQRHGTVHAFDPDRDPCTLAPFIGLLNERVDEVVLAQDGRLELALGRARVTVAPDDHQISWSVATADGQRASCIAEGRVVWE